MQITSKQLFDFAVNVSNTSFKFTKQAESELIAANLLIADLNTIITELQSFVSQGDSQGLSEYENQEAPTS
jgi:hypothetical protein